MKHALVAGAVIVCWTLAFGCAPDQPPVPEHCGSLADCPFGQICDSAENGKCIDEPPNRIIGTFHCTIPADGEKESPDDTAAVMARVGGGRWPMAAVGCRVAEEALIVSIGLHEVKVQADLLLTASKVAPTSSTLDLGPAGGAPELDSVRLSSPELGVLLGSSISGKVVIKGSTAVHGAITGFIDATMLAAPTELARFGEPCPQGIAQCGLALGSVGGTEYCAAPSKDVTYHVCLRGCTTDAECARDNAICLGTWCGRPCKTNADCTSPATCTSDLVGGPTGCE